MLIPTKASVVAIALALGGMSEMCAADGTGRTVAPVASVGDAKAAAKAARKATKALGQRKPDEAVAAAEHAVALAPAEAGYRMILGQSYLKGGRFRSAGQAFADTLRLEGGNGRAALNLALTQIAGDESRLAQQTLASHAGIIPASDRGLAMALAGDTAGALALLTQVARSAETSVTVRQNLALAYALAGQWAIARVVAAADLSPADVDERLQQWAAFAQPGTAAAQVASLLGVQPIADAGQPTALALVQPAPAPAIAAPVGTAQAEPVVAVAPVPVVAAVAPRVTFGPMREVVQPLPASATERVASVFKAAPVVPVRAVQARPAAGGWYVQIGAFDSAAVARDAWGRATRRYAVLGAHLPQGKAGRTGTATFYRLSVGGFSRAGAAEVCRQYRVRGGACFVRTGLGDQVAHWVRRKGVQLAAR